MIAGLRGAWFEWRLGRRILSGPAGYIAGELHEDDRDAFEELRQQVMKMQREHAWVLAEVTDSDKQVEVLEGLLRRLAASHEHFVRDHDDPGTEALSVQYLVRQRVDQGPISRVDPLSVEAIANDLDAWGLDSPDNFREIAKVVVDGIRARMDLR